MDKVMSFVAPDCFYHNIPMEPAVGTEAIRALVKSFVGHGQRGGLGRSTTSPNPTPASC